MPLSPMKHKMENEWGYLNIPDELELPEDKDVDGEVDEFVKILIDVMSRSVEENRAIKKKGGSHG